MRGTTRFTGAAWGRGTHSATAQSDPGTAPPACHRDVVRCALDRPHIELLDLVQLGLEADGVVVGYLPGLDMAEAGLHLVLWAERAMGIVARGGAR